MSKHGARVPAFSQLGFIGKIKTWYKKFNARRNRRGVRQAQDIQEFRDKPLDARAID